jgi:hypothetical protein
MDGHLAQGYAALCSGIGPAEIRQDRTFCHQPGGVLVMEERIDALNALLRDRDRDTTIL